MTDATNEINLPVSTESTRLQIEEHIKERNQLRGVNPGDPGYIGVSGGKKDTLIEALIEAEELEMDPLATDVETLTDSLKLDQLKIHEDNFRHDLDYHDPQMRDLTRKNNYKFFGSLIVTPDGGHTKGGEPTYRIISGNRSFHNFREVLKEDKVKTKDVEIPVSIRVYSGNEKRKMLAEIKDIGLANELQRPMSPIDKMHWYLKMSKLGQSQSAIAVAQYGEANSKGKQPIVSNLMGLARLPEEVQDLVHIGYHSNEYAANGQEWLDAQGVAYEVVGNDVKVIGISQANAEAMCKLYPRRDGTPEEEAGIKVVNDFLMSDPEVFENAINMSTSAFDAWLREAAQNEGIIEVKKNGEGKNAKSSGKPGNTAKSEKKAKAEEKPSGKTTPLESLDDDALSTSTVAGSGERPSYLSVDVTSIQAAQNLNDGTVVLAEDWNEKFVQALNDGEPGSLNAYKFLYHLGIFEED